MMNRVVAGALPISSYIFFGVYDNKHLTCVPVTAGHWLNSRAYGRWQMSCIQMYERDELT